MNEFYLGNLVGMVQTIIGHPLDTLQTNFQKAGQKAKDAGSKSPIVAQVAKGDTLTKGPNRANLKKEWSSR